MDSNTLWMLVAGVVLLAWLSKGAMAGVLGTTLIPYILQFFGILYLLDLSSKNWKMPEVQLPVPQLVWATPTGTPTAMPTAAPTTMPTLTPAPMVMPTGTFVPS